MPTTGSITKTIRINPKDLEVIEELMADGTTWSGAIHKLCEGVPQEVNKKPEGVPLGNYSMTPAVLEEFESAGKAYGMTGNELGRRIMLAMNLGLIFYEDNQFKAYAGEEYDLSKLKEACKEKGVPVQKAIDKAAQLVWNG